jgi:5-methylcytosine-specific restriction endonuclease McrA
MYVYVINKNGNPLMPCKPAKAKHLLNEGKAKCIRRIPFTIKLLWDCEENKQEVIAGMDTGSKVIGCAAITNGKVVYQSEIQVRQDVSKKMEQRKMYRRNRRGRKTRYRKARWQNRASTRRNGRLAPSIKSKVDSHLREKKFVESILPISKWKIETASFDIHKISNPNVKRWDYQKGNQKDFYNVKAYILHRDGYQCQKCKTKKGKLHVHHIIFRSKRGTNTPDNLITLCEECHDRLHNGEFEIKGVRSKTKHATEAGIVKSQLKKQFGIFEECFGYETKFKREQILRLPKSHVNDAIAICCEEGELVDTSTDVYFKKHVANGDYQQRTGKHSEKVIPTGKLFGLRKFDYIQTPKGFGFVKGKRSSGFFAISDLDSRLINPSVNVKKDCIRLKARTTTLIERRMVHSSTGQASVVSYT